MLSSSLPTMEALKLPIACRSSIYPRPLQSMRGRVITVRKNRRSDTEPPIISLRLFNSPMPTTLHRCIDFNPATSCELRVCLHLQSFKISYTTPRPDSSPSTGQCLPEYVRSLVRFCHFHTGSNIFTASIPHLSARSPGTMI